MAFHNHKKLKYGDIVLVNFALGRAIVRMCRFNHTYSDGETVWQVQDVTTGHCDSVGESWMETEL